MFKYKNIKHNQKGFTLIEMIVSISILLLVSGIAVSLFLSSVIEQRRIIEKDDLTARLGFALEYMSKGLRMATKDVTGNCLSQDCLDCNYMLTNFDQNTGNYLGIKFVNSSDNNSCQEFFLDKSDLQNIVIKEIKNNSDPVALTSSKIKINSFYFILNGDKNIISSYDTDNMQPRVTIFLDAELNNNSNSSTKIQTTVSQRNLNLR